MEYKQIVIGFAEPQRSDAESICEKLEAKKISVFMAEGSIVDHMSDEELYTVTDNCKALVLLLSEDTQNLDFVSKVLHMALDIQKLIIPIKLIDFEYNADIGPYLANVQQIFAYRDKESEIASVVKSLNDLIYVGDGNSYSLRIFLKKMLKAKLRKAWIKAKEIFKKAKDGFLKTEPVKKLRYLPCIAITLSSAGHIYYGICSSWRLTSRDVALITGVPLAVGSLLTLIFSLLLHKVKNKAVAIVLSLFCAVLIFVAMMMTGFFISQNIE